MERGLAAAWADACKNHMWSSLATSQCQAAQLLSCASWLRRLYLQRASAQLICSGLDGPSFKNTIVNAFLSQSTHRCKMLALCRFVLWEWSCGLQDEILRYESSALRKMMQLRLAPFEIHLRALWARTTGHILNQCENASDMFFSLQL